MSSASQKQWLRRVQMATDSERCESLAVARKFRRWIDAWEFMRTRTGWTPISALPISCYRKSLSLGSNATARTKRRIVMYFAAAGLVDYMRGSAGHVGLFRVRSKPRKIGQ